MDEGDDGDDDDGDSSRDDADDEDADEEDEEEHIAPADSIVFIPIVEPVSPPEGTEPVEVERLLAMTTPSPSPPISLIQHPLQESALLVTTALPSPPLPLLPPSLYIPPPIDHRDDVPESELPPRKRLCLSTLDSRYEIGESSTARPTRGRGVDYGFVSTVDAEAERRGIDLYALLEDAQDGRTRISQRVAMDLQRVTHQELQTHRDHVYAYETHIQAHQAQLQLQSTLIQTQHQMSETLRVMRDMRLEMSDMQAELLAHREQQRRARQPGPDARIPDHQDASRDADSHI
ncbi:hypothetical protein Tco_1009368 [Tanacetum coccineum]